MIKLVFDSTNINKSIKFPKLMISCCGDIVFMTGDKCGLALNKTFSGRYRTDWIMANFKDFNETITIQNIAE